MTTKLPVTGNQVSKDRSTRRGERGIALISVVAVLVLLTIVATPFLLTQRDSYARGQKFLYNHRAVSESESLFQLVRSHLTTSLEHLERKRLDALGKGGGATGAMVTPINATPSSDTLEELQLPAELLARFNKASEKEHRIWDVKVVDQQALFNLNSCSYPVLANILGRTSLSEALSVDEENTVVVADASAFPAENGIVRIGTEVIKYEQAVGNELLGIERAYKSELSGNGTRRDWDIGEPVILEAAFQIATRPFRAREGRYVRYTNIYQARSIGDMGVTTLEPSQFDLLRRYSTVWNGNAVGDGWCNPQTIRNNVTGSDQSQLYLQLKNVRYYGIGTLVRITDGVNSDYAVVTTIRGNGQVLIAGDIKHDYQADEARVYSLARSPINVNTATAEQLKYVFLGLKQRAGGTAISPQQAVDLAAFVKRWERVTDGVVEEQSEPGVYRTWEDFVQMAEQARDEGILVDDQLESVVKNAMNANDSELGFSTVPFVFRSYDIYEVRATASIMGPGGGELARRQIDRVFEAATSRTGTYVLETQDDFQRQIMKSRDGKWWATFPDNINAYFEGPNVPASEYTALAQKGRSPSTDRSPGVGDMRLLPGAMRYDGRIDRVIHFDESEIPDGLELEESPLELLVDTTYNANAKTIDLIDQVTIEGLGDDIDVGIKPFAGSFWYRPRWSRDNTSRVFFDYSLDERQRNRVTLSYDGERDMIVLAVADAAHENVAVEVFYDFEFTSWEADQWYHFGFAVNGCSPHLVELFVDGEKVGQASGITRLTGDIPTSGDVTSISVEDASSFPDTGVLLLRADEGIELIEYTSKNDGGFNVGRRKARSIDYHADETALRTHSAGDIVELYGFSAPLVTDIPRGGGALAGGLGPFRVYRFNYGKAATEYDARSPQEVEAESGDGLYFQQTAAAGEDPGPPFTLGFGLGNPGEGGDVVQDVRLSEWDTGDESTDITDDIGPAGTRGVGLIICRTITLDDLNDAREPYKIAGNPASGITEDEDQSYQIGGAEFVVYTVNGPGDIQIDQRNVDLTHVGTQPGEDGIGRFMPTYTYREAGSELDARGWVTKLDTGDPNEPLGHATAFIPIGILATGNAADYMDPSAEPQLGFAGANNQFAYIQIDGEWVKYDSLSDQIVSGFVAFYRDVRMRTNLGQFTDRDGNLVDLFLGGASSMEELTPSSDESFVESGGSGGRAQESDPPIAQELNDENTAPDDPSDNTSSEDLPPPFTARQIAEALDFRGYQLRSQDRADAFRIANTIPADHDPQAPVVPAFKVVPGNDLGAYGAGAASSPGAFPGFNDLLTLRDDDFDSEQIRIQWGYRGWCAPAVQANTGGAPTTEQTWGWDRIMGPQDTFDLSRFDSRLWTRAIKFPSGELPDGELTTEVESLLLGASVDDTIPLATCTVDEVVFWEYEPTPPDRPEYARLGQVPSAVSDPLGQQTGQAAVDIVYAGIDAEQDEFAVHVETLDESTREVQASGVPLDESHYPEDGGIIRIGEEVMLYEEVDYERGVFTGVLRGAFGSEATVHGYGEPVMPVLTFPSTVLTSEADESSAGFQVIDASDFPDDGYLRIADRGEIIGYTDRTDSEMSGPLGRIDPSAENERGPDDEEARVGGGLFRGRFGTIPDSYTTGDVVIAMPFRHYDRYAEFADHSELSYVQFSWTKHNAIWKRITWSETPVENLEVIALLRFSGGPEWDADARIRVGQEIIPERNRRQYIYEITDPRAENLLNVEADRLEVRLAVRFAEGAYDRFASEEAPNEWKETPWIEKVVVEYVAPPAVLTQE